MPHRNLGSAFIWFFPAASLLFVTGCGSMGFLGQRYDNFTAYYNGFYNAERVYAKGRDGLNRTSQPVDRTRFQSIFERQTGNTSSRDFESAVKKSADLLREHPDSKWVDDALLLIGKSYYYQENFVGAEQKFREVMLVSEEEAEDARFWLARTLITSGALAEARNVLTEGVASENVSNRWKAMFELALGEVAVKEGSMEEAAAFLEAGLQKVRDKEVGARAQFLYGQVLETLERPEEAVRAYDRVLKYRYSFELGYAAKYSAARVLGMQVNAEEGLERVRRLERDDKNVDSTGELRLLRGKILQEMGRVDAAYDVYDALLYEQNPGQSVTRVRSRVYLAMAEFHREVEGDFVMASAYYDSAATGLTPRAGARPGNAPRGTSSLAGHNEIRAPEALGEINDIKSSFAAFAAAYNRIAEMDSLLHLGSLPKEEFDARVLAMRQARARELAEQQRRREAERRNSQFQQQRAGREDVFRNQGLPEGKIVPGINDGVGSNAAGFLYHQDPIRVQEGVSTFRNKWGDRPLVPNWRREEAVRSSGGETADASGRNGEKGDGVDLDALLEAVADGDADFGLPQIDLSGIPRDSTSRADVRRRRALARYDVGNTLFLNMNMPDSAAAWYRLVVDEDADQPVARRALYALAEVQRALGDEDTANRLYREVLDRYPKSEFSTIVTRNLGLETLEVAADSALEARMDYASVRQRMDNSDRIEQYAYHLRELLGVAARWPEQEVAAQSMLAAARTHLEWADSDSARVVAPLPINPADSTVLALWPDRVVSEDTTTTAGSPVKRDALTPATTDSLVAESMARDSLAADSLAAVSLAADSLAAVSPPHDAPTIDAEPVQDSVRVGDLYSWVKEHFTGTPYFTEADRMTRFLDEFSAPPVNEDEVKRQLSANDSLVLAMLRGEKPLTKADSTVSSEESVEAREVEQDVPGIPAGATPDSSQAVIRDDLWPISNDNESDVQGEGFWLIVGPDHSDEDMARQNTSLLKRLLMGDASRVRVLHSTETEDGIFVSAIGPFATASDAVSYHADRENILRDRIRLFQLLTP